jgi:ABC-type multidrug transport system fused ATPase/permease subunit
MINLLIRLYKFISKPQKIQLYYLLPVMLTAAISEIISVGSIFPLLITLLSPNYIITSNYLNYNFANLEIDSENIFLLATAIFCLAMLFASIVRIFLVYLINKFAFECGADLSVKYYNKIISQPYKIHISRNSGEVIAGVTSQTHEVIYNIILPTVTIISAAITLLIVFILLLTVSLKYTLIIFTVVALMYCLLSFITKKKLNIYSSRILNSNTNLIKLLNESLGNIRDILLDCTQNIFIEIFKKSNDSLRKSQRNINLIAQIPRYAMECFGLITIALFALSLHSIGENSASIVATLGVVALGVQRLLPIFQQIYVSISQLNSARNSLVNFMDLINSNDILTQRHQGNILFSTFQSQIIFKDVSFKYFESGHWILRHVNLTINKGDFIGMVGVTGGGKSTFVDLLLGLLNPQEGEILIDGTLLTTATSLDWGRIVAHVPQDIYLSDGSFISNIAFGVPGDSIDLLRVKNAANKAQISHFIESSSLSYESNVGERGVQISGGQRQRIGVARAFYKNAQLIILDEATSALDIDTEESLMNSLVQNKSNQTIIAITHRISTLKKCNRIIQIEDGIIKEITYDILANKIKTH